jgi:hypothetical protein
MVIEMINHFYKINGGGSETPIGSSFMKEKDEDVPHHYSAGTTPTVIPKSQKIREASKLSRPSIPSYQYVVTRCNCHVT